MASAAKTSLSPMFSVRGGAKAIEYHKSAFAAEVLFRIGEEGKGVVAQMSVGGAELWLADEAPEYLNFSPESLGGGTVRMVMVVDDLDAAFTRAVGAGGKVVRRLRTRNMDGVSDGWSIRSGTIWEIGKPLG